MSLVSHLLAQSLTLYRGVEAVDAGGGRVVVFEQVDVIRAKVNQPTPEEHELAGVWGVQLSHVVHAENYVDVRRGDMLGGELPSEVQPEQRLRVVSVVSDSHSTYKRAFCEIVQSVDETLGGSSS